MDKYKENFEKGTEHYIKLLEEIKWFDNPYVEKDKVIENITKCTFPPNYSTYLRQIGYLTDYAGIFQLTGVLDETLKFIPDSRYEITDNTLTVFVKDEDYIFDFDVNEFEAGEGIEGFAEAYLNQILEKEGIEYRFYELPPDDETVSLIFVKPEVYKQAIKYGIIPDFLGYFAVNY